MATSAHPVVTPNNFSSIPLVISWFVGVTVVLCVLATMVTKLTRTRTFAKDDLLIVVSMVFSIGLVVSVSVAGTNGLGRHEDSQTEAQLERYQKSIYAAELLNILALFFSKSSLLFLFTTLAPKRKERMVISALGGIMLLWAASSFFVTAFQCPAPRTWTVLNDKCLNQFALWTYFGAMNILLEVLLIVAPAILISNVQIPSSKKATVRVIFALRIFVIAAIVAELYFRHRASQSTDATFATWQVVVCMLFVQCLSIIFSCVPFLQPFFTSLESGMIRLDDTRRLGGTRTKSSLGLDGITMRAMGSKAHVVSGHKTREDSRESLNSTSNIIRATTTFEVRSEEVPKPYHTYVR